MKSNQFPPSLQFGAETSLQKLKISESYTHCEEKIFKNEKLFAPVSTVNLLNLDKDVYSSGFENELAWLNGLDLSFTFDSWAGHHSKLLKRSQNCPGINCILPLIPKPVHALDMQYHCMKLIKNTTNYFHLGQTQIDVIDQPIFALTKEIQY